MIVTIDGPAGGGKSTVARKLAVRLNVPYLDTGAMYRAIGHQAIADDIDLSDTAKLLEITQCIDIALDCGPTHTHVHINGNDVTESIRTLPVSEAAGAVARIQAIRDILVDRQREIGATLGSFVSEGRDQGSVVFPDADVRFVLEATPQCRAQRRLDELNVEGERVTLEQVLADIKRRDANDRRQWAPLLDSKTAIRIDTTDMTIEKVVDKLAGHVQQRTLDSPSNAKSP